ncbi:MULTISPECIES: DUF1552 domain-containing protein [Sorangium]|uniref:Uncharacterized protein n=1 Tax=Sorangium cellulosum TaxID=56 RepID=A0A4P2QHU0_SORCE|nr:MULTISPECIES: DUF1552 domain-containing protein [Sorangium]AUX29435.1 hypothetical protein SOCE836_015250 [Sorangium cellulosum]WCQ88830.1 hypothetical protein NQZ70_01512 [Sorangium sp. Soce836]
MKPFRLSRRAVLRGLGGAALALPFLEVMGCSKRLAPASEQTGRAAFGAEFPKRFVVIYTPNGTVPPDFWPSSSQLKNGEELSPILAPLKDHNEDLLVLGNVSALSALTGPGDAHQKGTGQCLTARPMQEGDFPGDAGLSCGWADGISVDQEIANHIGTRTKFLSLELGVLVYGANVGARIAYRGPAQPLPPENSPYAAFDRLFSDLAVTPETATKKTEQRRAVLDKVAADYKRLQRRLGAADQEKLAGHLASVEDIASRLDRGVAPTSEACAPPELTPDVDPDKVANMPEVTRLQLDLMAMALACDLTRVASLQFTNSATTKVLSFLGPDITEGHHPMAHNGYADPVNRQRLTKISRFYAEQLAYLIAKLKSMPEGNGSVFDNTVIFWTNEHADGNHLRQNIPYVLAGSAAGHFKTGRFVSQAKQVGHNDLLVSLLQAMGVDTESFGDPKYCTGPLKGLTS